MRRLSSVVAILVVLVSAGAGQEKTAPRNQPASANPEDVKSIEAIVRAVYECVSGPAGEKHDWDRFRSLFLPGARLIPAGRPSGEAGTPILTVDEYIRGAQTYFEKNSLYESEVAQHTHQYRHIAQVFSTYGSRKAPGGAFFARGINGFDLVNDGQRWWVVTVFWDIESAENPIPEEYLGTARSRSWEEHEYRENRSPDR